MQRTHLIFPTVLGLHLGCSLPYQHYFFYQNDQYLQKVGSLPPSLQIYKGELKPVVYFSFPKVSLRFKQMEFFIFGEARPLHTMGGGRTEK